MKKIALLFIFFIIFSIFASRAGSHRVFFPIDAGLSNFNVPTQTTCFGSLQTISVLLANAGTTPIGTGSATVFLKIGGANYFSATANNSTTIPGNGAEWIYFTGVNMSNPGTNFDSVYVILQGDLSHGNDSLFANNLSAFTIGSFPADEKFDAGSMIFGYSKMINGGINLTRLQTGMYTNPALGGTLAPHSGNNFMLFDNYTGNNTAGVVNRLYSDCFVLPVSGTGACSYKLGFWMSHDASQSTKADSLYVTVSADHGISWVRQGQGFSRYNSSFILSGWKIELIDLSGFAGQVIQIGFEDVSRSGNIIGLDDITVGSVAVQNISLNTIASNSIPLQKACDDQGWTYYVDPSIPGQYLLGIQWDPSAAGANLVAKNLAIPHLQLDAQHFAIEDIVAKKATYTMKRYWNVNLNGTTLSSPVNLRYFYDSVEKAEVDNKAFNFAAANNGFLETGLWFKTLSGDFSSDAVHVTLDGVTNAMSLVNSNAASNKMNNVAYVQFNGITSFSGGTYASGVGPNSLVPLNLLNFNIQRSGKVNLISWSTAQEVNTDYMSPRKPPPEITR